MILIFVAVYLVVELILVQGLLLLLILQVRLIIWHIFLRIIVVMRLPVITIHEGGVA
jgi:hypothetical protein